MAASKEIGRAHFVYFRLQMFANPVTTSTIVAFTFLDESQLCHDGSEAAGGGVLLQVAPHADLGGDFGEGEEHHAHLGFQLLGLVNLPVKLVLLLAVSLARRLFQLLCVYVVLHFDYRSFLLIYYNYINNGTELEVTYETTSFSSYSGSVVIPEEITYMNNTLKVTSIGSRAFYKSQKMTSVTIPGSVTNIAERAFQYCRGLPSITIPNSVTSIGMYAFAMCNMPSITVPSSVTSIGGSAFRDSGLTSVTIGAGIIWDEAFSGCMNLTSVTLGSGVTRIGDYAFQYCYSLPSITIPDGVTSMGIGVFYECRELTSVTIGKDVTSIGNLPFCKCPSLTSVKVDPENTAYDTRDNCNAIILTASDKLIAGCQTSTIPNGVKEIGTWAFFGSEQEVISKIENPFDIYTNTFSENTFLNATLYVPIGTIDKYKATEGWKLFANIKEGEPSGVTSFETEKAKEIKRYALDGRPINNSHKGITIIQMNDGTTQKVVH